MIEYLVDTFDNSGIVQLLEFVEDDQGRRVIVERLHLDGDTDIVERDEPDDIATRRLYRAFAGMR